MDKGVAEIYAAALGIPKWVKHLRKINSINTTVALLLSAITVFSNSFLEGLAYAGLYALGWAIVSVIGVTIAQSYMVTGILFSTLSLLALNLALAYYLLW